MTTSLYLKHYFYTCCDTLKFRPIFCIILCYVSERKKAAHRNKTSASINHLFSQFDQICILISPGSVIRQCLPCHSGWLCCPSQGKMQSMAGLQVQGERGVIQQKYAAFYIRVKPSWCFACSISVKVVGMKWPDWSWWENVLYQHVGCVFTTTWSCKLYSLLYSDHLQKRIQFKEVQRFVKNVFCID